MPPDSGSDPDAPRGRSLRKRNPEARRVRASRFLGQPMNEDSSPTPLESAATGGRRRRVRFDPTVNLGHLLSLASFLVAGLLAYTDLRERIVVQEVRHQQVQAEIAADKARTGEVLRDLREDLKDVKRGVDTLAAQRRGGP